MSTLSLFKPELEIVDKSHGSVRYLEHGWPTELCRWHAHEEYELHLILATHGKIFMGDYIGQFEPGSLYLAGPRLPHNWVTAPGHEPVKLRDMLLQFQHDSLVNASRVYPELKEMSLLLEMAAHGIEFVGFDADNAKKKLEAIRDSEGMKSLLAFFEFMLELNDWPHKRTLSVLQMSSTNIERQTLISDMVEFVLLNYTSPIQLNTVADLAGMSPSGFSRHFQQVTGNRFTDFVSRVRVGHACELLMESEELVAEIGTKVGFQNLANFNRHFQRVKGMAPSEYRRLAREGLAKRQLPQKTSGEGEIAA